MDGLITESKYFSTILPQLVSIRVRVSGSLCVRAFTLKMTVRVGEVVQQVKALAATRGDPSSILETHVVGENQLLKAVL